MTTSHFHLKPPPEFRGLHPTEPIHVYRRFLPHWRQVGATYVVTFRLVDALPQEKLKILESFQKQWEQRGRVEAHRSQRDAKALRWFSRMERWLNQGHGSCLFANLELACELSRILLFDQDVKYFLSCFTIMPNHVHLIIRPFDGYRLEKLVGVFKGVSARRVNQIKSRAGGLWMPECHDRIIRDEEHLYQAIQYIGNNPRMANIPKERWCRWVHPKWEALGWGFREP